MVQNFVKETNFKLQRGKLQCTSGDWSHWPGSTNLAVVKITDSTTSSAMVVSELYERTYACAS